MSSPIVAKFPLDRDVLWRILSLNANMGQESEAELPALITLRHASQVCSSWRELTLTNTSWWGRIINLNHLRQSTDDWRSEVLRRSGESLINVGGNCGDNVGTRNFVRHLLDNHWDRIRCLYLHRSDGEALNTELLAVCQRPAPHLEEFMVPVVFRPDEVFSDPSFDLFARASPLLRIFNSFSIPFNLQAAGPWVSQISIYDISRLNLPVVSTRQVLNLLARMPFLESIEIPRLWQTNPIIRDNSGVALPKAFIPSLKRIVMDPSQCILGWLEIIGNVSPAADCGLWLNHYTGSVITAPELQCAASVLSSHAERYFKAKYATEIYLHLDHTKFILRDDTKYQDSFALYFNIKSADVFPDRTLSGLLGALTLCRFDSIQKLSFAIAKAGLSHDDPNLAKLVPLFSSVKVLEIIDLNTLAVLLEMSTTLAHPSFPVLEVIEIPYARETLAESPITITIIGEFLISRREAGVPIRVLNLRRPNSGINVINMSVNLSFLEEQVGLTVLWAEYGEQMEYLCGSGLPEILSRMST